LYPNIYCVVNDLVEIILWYDNLGKTKKTSVGFITCN